MRARAVLFDLDGTLLDTLEDLAFAGNEALRSLGHPPHPTDAYRHFVGDGVRVLLERILPAGATPEEVSSGVERMLGVYAGCWREHTRPYPGVDAMLEGLFDAGLRVTIYSNKPHAFTVQTVEALLGRWPFHAVLGAREGLPKKPHPAGAIEVAREVGVDPAAFLYCGDTNTDMLTARAAGMRPLGALWGFRDEAELRDAGAVAVLPRPESLLDHVEERS